MAKNIINEITNQKYLFDQAVYPPINGYLIVSEKEGKAAISHFGEHITPHMEMIDWYNNKNIKILCVFTNGNMPGLIQLKDELNKQPIDEVIGQLERELLK